MKTCTACKTKKSLDNFYKKPKGKLGYDSICIVCRRNYGIKHYYDNHELIKTKGRQIRGSLKCRYSNLRSNARTRNIYFDISFEGYALLAYLPCHYCGLPLSRTGGGLDRVDSNKGYTIDNVAPCCAHCNYIFNDYTKEETYSHMELMLKMRP